MHQVQILNRSTLATPQQLAPIVAAMQMQIDQHFAPAYGRDVAAKVTYTEADNGDWPCYLIDDDAQAPPGALAWHTVDDRGRPYAIVPLRTVLQYDAEIGVTISHEILEMLADPFCERSRVTTLHDLPGWPGVPVDVAYEPCDPVEGDSYAISTPAGVANVSNFVYPNWYQPGSGGPWDFLGKAGGPFKMTRGGYLQYNLFGQWHQQTQGRLRAARSVESYHCRRHRRQRRLYEASHPGHHTLLGQIETALHARRPVAAMGAVSTIAAIGTVLNLVQTLSPSLNAILQQILAALQPQPKPAIPTPGATPVLGGTSAPVNHQ